MPPSIICPSAPILNNPALKPTAIPKAAKINGVAAVNVSDIADNEPKEPVNNATNAVSAIWVLDPETINNSKPRNIANKVAITGIRMISWKVSRLEK